MQAKESTFHHFSILQFFSLANKYVQWLLYAVYVYADFLVCTMYCFARLKSYVCFSIFVFQTHEWLMTFISMDAMKINQKPINFWSNPTHFLLVTNQKCTALERLFATFLFGFLLSSSLYLLINFTFQWNFKQFLERRRNLNLRL